MSILITLLFIIILLATNYIALDYGVKIGKSMQGEPPPLPFEPEVKSVKKFTKAVLEFPKRYRQKLAPPKDDENPMWN